MEATVYFPTYKNKGSIFALLKSLEKQTRKNFTVLICYRKSDSDAVLGRLEEYKGLSLDIRFQRTKYWAECMNLMLSKSEGDVTISTDDDAIAPPDWIEKHVAVHRKYKKAGAVTGAAPEVGAKRMGALGKFLDSQKWRITDYRLFDRPIDRKFSDYGMYIGKSGMLVDTGRSSDLIKTMKQHGVNMSWKREMAEGFRLPNYCVRLFHWESAIGLELLKRGYDALYTEGISVSHQQRASVSRNYGASAMPEWILGESVLFAYFVSRYYDVDLGVLKARTAIADTISMIVSSGRNRGYGIGYGIAKRAIEEDWKPQDVLKASEKAISYGI